MIDTAYVRGEAIDNNSKSNPAFKIIELCGEIDRLRARIADLEAKQVPDGWVAVPVELTTDIRNAFDDVMHNHLQCYLLSNDIEQVWRAMLAARRK
jgi:hypothetical protein